MAAKNDDALKDAHVPRAYQEEIFAEARRTNVIAALGTGAGKTLIAAMLVRWAAATQSQSQSQPSSSSSSSSVPQPQLQSQSRYNIDGNDDDETKKDKNEITSNQALVTTSKRKVVVFLVPKVPLVYQQRDFLARQTPLDVRAYSGAMGTDAWDRGRWAREFNAADVLVMTGAPSLYPLPRKNAFVVYSFGAAQVFKNILTHGAWSLENVCKLIFSYVEKKGIPFSEIS